jgi:hypothetical protein
MYLLLLVAVAVAPMRPAVVAVVALSTNKIDWCQAQFRSQLVVVVSVVEMRQPQSHRMVITRRLEPSLPWVVDAAARIAEVTVLLVVQAAAVALTQVSLARQQPVRVLLAETELAIGHKLVRLLAAAAVLVVLVPQEILQMEMVALVARSTSQGQALHTAVAAVVDVGE